MKISKQKYNLILDIICVTFFLLIIYSRNVLGIDVPIIFTTILIAFYMLVSKRSIAEILAFLIPFRSAIQGNYIVLISMTIYMIKEKGKFKTNKNFILLLLILLLELLNSFDEYTNFIGYISFSLSLIFLYFIIYSNYDKNEEIEILKNNVYGFCISSLIYLVKTFKNITLMGFVSGKYRLGSLTLNSSIGNFGLGYNANEIAMFALLGISILIYLKKQKMINKYFFYPSLAYFLLIGILSMSRAFLLGFVVYTILLLISNIKKVIYIIGYVFIISILILLLFSLNSSFFNGIILNYQNRFNTSDVTGNRTQIISDYNKIIFSSSKNILMGSGIQNYSQKNNYPFSSHNAVQEAFIAWGLIGGCAFIILIISFIKYVKVKGAKYDLNDYLPLLSLLFMIQTIPFLSQGIIIFLFYAVLMPFKVKSDKGEHFYEK